MKFRKKPIVIEAFKWTGDGTQCEDPIWVIEAINNGTIFFTNKLTRNVKLCINTLEGTISFKGLMVNFIHANQISLIKLMK